MRTRDLPNTRIGITGSYTEPLSKTGNFQFSNSITFSNYQDKLKTFHKDQIDSEYTNLDPSFSNAIQRNSFSNVSTVGATWAIKKLHISPKVGIQFLSFHNDFEKPKISNQTFTYFQPGFSLNWNGIFFNYFSSVIEPRIIDLQPVADNTNPLYLKFGNPNLKPSITQSIYLTYDKYNTKKLLTYRCLLSSIFYTEGTIFQKAVDSLGIQSTLPLNTSGVYTYRANISVTKQIKVINKLNLSITGNIYTDFFRTKVIVNYNTSDLNNFSITPSINYSLNCNDQIEFNQEYSFRLNTGKYSNNYFENSRIISHHLSSEFIYRHIKHFVMETFFDYFHNTSISSQFDKNYMIWNCAVNFLILKEQKGNIKVSVYDILNQNKSITRAIAENMVVEEQITTLQRFFLLSFVYNIRNVKLKKVGGRDRLLLF